MAEREKSKFSRIVRNSVTAAVIIAAPPAAAHVVNAETESLDFINNRPVVSQQISPDKDEQIDNKLFDQVGDFVETKNGRALASAILLFALAQGLYTIQQSVERDKKRKLTQSAAASGLFFSLAAVIFAQSYTEVDPKVPAFLLTAYSLAQSAYNIENSFERDRPKRKRAAALAATAGLLAASSTILADSVK